MNDIAISEQHRYGTDSVLLGEFAAQSDLKHKTVADLCSGCGIVPVMLKSAKVVYAVEIQAEAVALIERNFANLENPHMHAVHGDLKCGQVLSRIGRESVDLVTANPPYYIAGSGFERANESQKTARYEGDCTLTDVVAAANFLLKFGGSLKMCMTAPRLAETIGVMQTHGIEPKEIVLIAAKKSDTARLFLISGKKGGKSGVKVTWK
jgi:tRNA1(Val) A37 N6-methylase TrmN6